ncbi:MAG: hypothetical protein QOH29_703, partial [Actinomycetota bacterium]|nr:hypothetical protein [Actinomycetota bacterium]
VAVGTGPRAVAVDSGAHRAYIANYASNTISAIDTTTNTVVATVAVGVHPYGVAVDTATHTAYVTISTGGVAVISGASNTVVGTVTLGGFPFAVAVDPATHSVYVTNYNAGVLSVISGSSRAVVATVTVGAKPSAVAVDVATHTVYVSNHGSGSVSVINGSSHAVTGTVAVGGSPDGLAIAAGSSTLFVTNGADGSVAVVDQATNTVQSSLTSGTGAQAVVVDPSRLTAFVCNTGAGTVSVIGRQLPGVTIARLAGPDRFATAAAVSQAAFPSGGAGGVVLADGGNYPDALVGAPLAAVKNAPLLLTSGTALPAVILTEIQRVLPAGGTVYILGGTVAVPLSITAQLTTLGYAVVRYGGATRFATAVAVADAIGDPATVLLATGANFPDALAAGVAASKAGGVVLLTNGSSMAPETAAYLTAHAQTVYALGGAAAAADPAATAIVGADRYDTAAGVAQHFFTGPGLVGIASGAGFADALSGGAYLAHLGGALLLATPAQLSVSDTNYLRALAGTTLSVQLFGGVSALGPGVEGDVFVALGG